ncbi:DUF418 domain-containing protein [Paenibacillus sedimenti]|uniref:DUF418 domain-containing protein n=1 Tax=Paenibacillus sedimenti TaxID=2770274 RepID=A0A926QLU1_9BACL|nr:DUF418 domain-containing protein [Paenibacillus sedimenti]MBD0383995.1 DUF418 domain-containing protein [Paenibacillus sedimenti]
MMKANPVPFNERNIVIDILRGFALLGILLMNLPQFFYPSWMYGVYSIPSEYTGTDRVGELLIRMFVEGKFFTIFSFLFGLGFFIFMKRAESKALNIKRLYLRRIAALALFGVAHFFLVWTGDILHLYAITGLFLLFFHKRKSKTILIWIVCLVAVWFGLFGLAFITTPEQAQNSIHEGLQLLPVVDQIFDNLTYAKWIDYQLNMVAPAVAPFEPIFMPAILAMFLIGVFSGQKDWFANLPDKKRSIRKMWFISLAVNLPLLSALAVLLTKQVNFGFRHETVTTVLVQFSGITLSIFYILSFLLLMTNSQWITRLRPIGYVGQMALTNYLSQTIICVALAALFHLYRIGTIPAILMSISIYACQIVFSTLWMRNFRYGPMEWVWRSFTYLSLQPMRLKKPVPRSNNHMPLR